MQNEYGVQLDRNGYAPSLIEWREGECLICGRSDRPIQRHEVFHGSYRERSKNLGCWVNICDECHRAIHQTAKFKERALKNLMQRAAMKHYNWSVDLFRQNFGKNYLEEVDE